MYLKKSNFAIYLTAAALVGFGASFLFGLNDSENGLLSGDISKASRYNNVKEDPEMAVVVEKLQNDTAFFNQTKMSVDYLKTRVSSLAVLAEETARICNDVPELSANVTAMNSLSAKAYNTSNAFDAVSGSLELIQNGKKAPAYEQAANNAYVGFQKIENQMYAGKDFVESAGKYLEDKNLEENGDLAGVVAMWSVYCAQDAVLTDNRDNLKYWAGKIGTDAVVTQAMQASNTNFENLSPQLQACATKFGVLEMVQNMVSKESMTIVQQNAAQNQARTNVLYNTAQSNVTANVQQNAIPNQVKTNVQKNAAQSTVTANVQYNVQKEITRSIQNAVQSGVDKFATNVQKNNFNPAEVLGTMTGSFLQGNSSKVNAGGGFSIADK